MNNCLWRKKKKIFWNLISRKVENAGHTCYKCRQLICNESMIKSKHLGFFLSSFHLVEVLHYGSRNPFYFYFLLFWVSEMGRAFQLFFKMWAQRFSVSQAPPAMIHLEAWNKVRLTRIPFEIFHLKNFRWRSLQGLPLPSLWPSWSVLIFFDSSYLFCIWPFVMRHWHLFGVELNDGLFTCW